MTTLSKACVIAVAAILALNLTACDDKKIVNRGTVDHSNGVIDGEWSLVRYCGGYTGDCHYPGYFGKIVVRFSVIYFEEYIDGELTATGTFERTDSGSDQIRYKLSRSDLNFTQSVWLSSSTELVIADPCCDMMNYIYEPY